MGNYNRCCNGKPWTYIISQLLSVIRSELLGQGVGGFVALRAIAKLPVLEIAQTYTLDDSV